MKSLRVTLVSKLQRQPSVVEDALPLGRVGSRPRERKTDVDTTSVPLGVPQHGPRRRPGSSPCRRST